MERRPKLQGLLERDILGSRNVYFQPPDNLQMTYPAIKYELDDIKHLHANNKPYSQHPGYIITLIDENPDSEYVEKLASLPMCSFDRFYKADNLNHWVFILYQ